MNLFELKNRLPAAPMCLAQIFLIKRQYGTVPNHRLAERLRISRPAVSQAIGRLKKFGLAMQSRYGDITLTDEGKKLAVETLRRHFLLEHLLVRLLGYAWDKSDQEAENLQDTVSQDLADHLAERLGNPQTCPHGNPLPDSEQEEYILSAPPLDSLAVKGEIEIVRITEEGELLEGMLPFCEEKSLTPGVCLSVVKRDAEGVFCRFPSETSSFLIPSKFTPYICCFPRG